MAVIAAGRNRAVFLDKDGTLIENVPHNVDPALVRLAPTAAEAVGLLRSLGFLVVVVSNQPGVGLGYFAADALRAVERRLDQLLRPLGGLDGFYICPHHPYAEEEFYRGPCSCRKPEPGLLVEAALDLDIDLTASWMVGDILDDVEAGRRAGCGTLLLDNGNETEWVDGPLRRPDWRVATLAEGARRIAACAERPPRE